MAENLISRTRKFFDVVCGGEINSEIPAGGWHQMVSLGDINDSLGFRSARLATKGNVTGDMSYIIEFDFAQSQGIGD